MKAWIGSGLLLVLMSCVAAQVGQSNQGTGTSAERVPAQPGPPDRPVFASQGGQPALRHVLEANVKAEWEAFKNKDKKAYADLLADDFVAVEDDGEGMRKKSAAVGEVDRSLVSKSYLYALSVLPLRSDAALVTYELTMEFPPKAQVRFKRVLVSELWLKRAGKWKLRYYQETRVR